jgi:hypothetical protein
VGLAGRRLIASGRSRIALLWASALTAGFVVEAAGKAFVGSSSPTIG